MGQARRLVSGQHGFLTLASSAPSRPKLCECRPLLASSAANDDKTDVSMAADDALAVNFAAISAAVLRVAVGAWLVAWLGAWLVSIGSAGSSVPAVLLPDAGPLDIDIWVSLSELLGA